MDLIDLEEGELSDDEDIGLDLYTPLERPAVARPAPSNLPAVQDDSSDSDDSIPCGKRLRMSAPSCQIPKKYCVWAPNANDDIADILTTFGMDTPENDRNVENYPIPKEKLMKVREAQESERRRKIPTGRKLDPLAPLPVPKELGDVDVTDLSSIEETAEKIAEQLDEKNKELVTRIVLILGKQSAVEYFRKTREIESKGGLLILNGSRRRTSGGVFIHLIRTDKQIPGSKLVEIFEDPAIVNINRTSVKLRKRKLREKVRRELSNPPPSPEVPAEDLPKLPLRRDLVQYEEVDFLDFP